MLKKTASALNLTEGSIVKKILIFAFPILLGNMLQECYHLADTLVVGRTLGVHSLAAVGTCGPLVFFVMGFIMGLTGGCAVITAQRFGANDEFGVKQSIAAHIVIGFITTLVLTIFFVWVSPSLLNILHVPEVIYRDAYIYLVILYAGMFAAVIYNLFSSSLRSIGDSKTPLMFLIFSSLLNIALDLFFILFCGWGIVGAASATVLSQLISGLLCWAFAAKCFPMFIPHKDCWRNLGGMIKDELKVGVPMGFQFSFVALGMIVLQSVLNNFGANAIAAFTVGSRVQFMLNNPIASMSIIMATFVGQNYGARKFRRIKTGVNKCLAFAVGLSICMGVTAILFADNIIAFFIGTEEQEVLVLANEFIDWVCPMTWALAFLFVCRGALQGLGDGVTPMIGSIAELVMRSGIPLIFAAKWGFASICVAGPAAWLSCGSLMTAVYFYKLGRMRREALHILRNRYSSIDQAEAYNKA
ncbi:MAG: MATE family efflux transporter [bacterium]|nr:MATE family efflux transporter [bacterium]